MRQNGYLYGETWRSLENPRVFMVLSVWGQREYWDNWFRDEFQRKIDDSIAPTLRRPSTIRIYEELSSFPSKSNGEGAHDAKATGAS